jgi:branched-chain amino acid transport system substrate-binding protein
VKAKRGVLGTVALVAVVALVGAGCAKKTAGAQKTVKIAYQGALTGAAAQLVIPGWQGAKLAFDQANAGKFGKLPVKIAFVQEDTQGNPSQAPPVATKVSNDPTFVGVIGPAFSGESLAAGPLYDAAGLPFITASATRTVINQQGWSHWFRANANDDEQGPSAAHYIAKVLKPNCAFVTTDDSAYGSALGSIVQSTVEGDGVAVQAQIQAVATGQKDFSALITKVQNSGCKAMFYGGYSPEAGLLRKQMTQAGLSDVTLVGGDGIKDTTFVQEAGSAGPGTIAACPCVDITKSDDPSAKTFIDDYTQKWHQAPGIYSAEYYDVARMYIEALKAGKTTRAALTQYFYGIHYNGLTKNYVFLTTHELNQSTIKIFFWKDNGSDWEFQGEAKDVGAV